MKKMYDYVCECGNKFEALVEENEIPICPECHLGGPVSRRTSGGHIFTVIKATTNTSKKYKAGYQHSHTNRPKEKISVQVPSALKT